MIPRNPPMVEVFVPDRERWSGDDPDKHRTQHRVFPEPSVKCSHAGMVAHETLQVNKEPEPE